MSRTAQPVAGFCPMGCGQTLVLGEGGHVTCAWLSCPDPGRADAILHEREHEHTVKITADGFDAMHPLRERGEELFECGLHRWLTAQTGPPAKPGTYRVRPVGSGWSFEEIVGG